MTRLTIPDRLIVVAPHPDDETIAAYATIRATLQSGKRVDVVIVTDGTASHRNSISHPPRRLAKRRAQESRTAMRNIGLSAQHIHFANLRDGSLGAMDVTDLARRLKRILQPLLRRCTLVIAPARCDRHPDHAQIGLAISMIVPHRQSASYRVWSDAVSCSASRRWQVRADGLCKRMAIKRYHSQNGAIADDPEGFALSARDRRAFAQPSEYFGTGP